MRYWKCTVCGYIHEGAEPPERCPICGAPREKFVELPGEEGRKAREAYMEKMGDKVRAAEKRAEQEAAKGSAIEAKPGRGEGSGSGLRSFLFKTLASLHAHPISVHIPNGVLPFSVFLLFLSMFIKADCLSEASLYSLAFVVAAMPGVLFTGYVDWKERLGGEMTRPVITKMICGAAVFIIGLLLLGWRLFSPEVVDSSLKWTYFLVNLLMLAFAGYAGFLGGRLVFKD